jgi:hypothetical protein
VKIVVWWRGENSSLFFTVDIVLPQLSVPIILLICEDRWIPKGLESNHSTHIAELLLSTPFLDS